MRLLICALWSPAGKGLTFWLSFVVSNCEFVTFPLVTVSIHCAHEMSEIDCIGKIESFWPKFVRGW